MEPGPAHHALLPGRRQPHRRGRIPHAALAPLPDPREDATEAPDGNQRASERREVFRDCESCPGDGAAAWTPHAGYRRRSAQPRNAPPSRSFPDPGFGRIPFGRVRRVRRTTARAYGKSVLHACWPRRRERSRTALERPSEIALAARRILV